MHLKNVQKDCTLMKNTVITVFENLLVFNAAVCKKKLSDDANFELYNIGF
jgi:hypothetical protein